MTWMRSVALTALCTVSFAASAVAQVGRTPGMLDPNLATEQELLALPNLTAPIVKGIIEGRPFLAMADLNALLSKSLTAAQLTELYPRLWLHLNLNTATRDEIVLIPGAGNRMAREFFEYRPWKAMAQFDREIGKYVDEAEVARLKGYVFIPVELNTAADEAILTIPGVGPRMLREFKEYRPWKSEEQFKREIGKYVDAKEVARLWRYVTIAQ